MKIRNYLCAENLEPFLPLMLPKMVAYDSQLYLVNITNKKNYQYKLAAITTQK
ncbi:hypothetical protein [Mastigocoleus sp. MO_188.B34]|uniref:hypothetical protein n=1 Tax=Mastigocoleus sp. MO_188.B34 TaxID=3036635 RepID=UPI0026334BC9|nr:hypothetical protein [Mastigocoleus sp. MO_188.B34]